MSLTALGLMHNALYPTAVLLHLVVEAPQIGLQILVRVVVCWFAKKVRITLLEPFVESQNIAPSSFLCVTRFEQLSHAIQSYSFSIFFHMLDSTRSQKPGKTLESFTTCRAGLDRS
jgi:hypothetical protein